MIAAVLLIAAAQCATTEPGFTWGLYPDATQTLNDFGRVHADADTSACSHGSLFGLLGTVKNIVAPAPPPNPSDDQVVGWKRGYQIGLAYAAAVRMGAYGWASNALDSERGVKVVDAIEERVRTRGFFITGEQKNDDGVEQPDPNFQKNDVDTRSEEYAGPAMAYAWMAAYHHRRGREDDAAWYRSKARERLDRVFSDACIHLRSRYDSDRTKVCNATVAELDSGAVTFTINSGIENPNYGFGVMNAIASFKIAMEIADEHLPSEDRFRFTPGQKAIAKAWFEEMQRKADVHGNFYSTCVTVRQPNGPGTAYVLSAPNQVCDQGGYHGGMYALKAFYDAYLGGIPNANDPTKYRSIAIDTSKLHLTPDAAFIHFTYGRYELYAKHAHEWIVRRPPFMPRDDADPIGWFDDITSTGVATGWTCDPDFPQGSLEVQILDTDTGEAVASGFASGGSEPAVIDACRGGVAHRFAIELPPESKGTSVAVYGADYTRYGYTPLPCGPSGSICARTW